MHEFIILASLLILFSCKSSKTFFENINSKRIITGYNHVNSQIKFESIDEERIVNVSRNNMFIINFKLRNVINQVDSSTS